MRHVFRSCFYQVHNVDRTSLCCTSNFFVLSVWSLDFWFYFSMLHLLYASWNTCLCCALPQSTVSLFILVSLHQVFVLSQFSGCYPRSPQCDPGISVIIHSAFSIIFFAVTGARCYDPRKLGHIFTAFHSDCWLVLCER